MTPILIYILKVNGLLLIVYLFYKLFLQKETYVRANRLYFLLGVALSVALPLFTYTKVETVEFELIPEKTGIVVDANLPMKTGDYVLSSGKTDVPVDANRMIPISDSTLSNEEGALENTPNSKDLKHLAVETAAVQQSDWTTVDYYGLAMGLFLVMTALSLLWLVYKVQRLVRHIYRLPISQIDASVRIDHSTTDAYSFLRWVVLPSDYKSMDQLEVVLAHERVHVRQWHSVDLILMEILKHLFWFNPVLHLLQKEVNLNLEYIVDEQIAREEDVYSYQRALVLYESNKLGYTPMVNTFGSSDLKKRILMLNNPKSTNMKRLKYLLLSPVIGGFFFLFQIEVQAQYVAKVSDTSIVPEPPQPMSVDVIEEMIKVGEEAKLLGEEAKRIGEEAKRVGEDAKTSAKKREEINTVFSKVSVSGDNNKTPLYVVDGNVAKEIKDLDANTIESIDILKGDSATALYGNRAMNGAVVIKLKKNVKDVPYIVNGFVYSYNEFTALGNPVSSIANMDVIDAEAATKRYGEVGKNGAIVVKLKPDTEWTNKGSFMDGARNVGYASGTSSYKLSLEDKEGNTIESKTYKSRAEMDKAMEAGIKKLDEEAKKKEIEARKEDIYAQLGNKKQENTVKREKAIAEAEKRKDEVYKAQKKVLDDARKRGDKNLVDNAVMYVEGKELSMDKSGEYKDQVKSVRIYTNTDAKAKLGYTGEYKVMELTLKTEEDRENEKKVAEVTKKYKAQVADRFNEVKKEEFSGLLLVNNVEKSSTELKSINSADIVTMEVYRGTSAIEKYGEKAKGGVIFIRTK